MKLKKVDENKRSNIYDLSVPVPEETMLDKVFSYSAGKSFPLAWLRDGRLHVRIKVPKTVEVKHVQTN